MLKSSWHRGQAIAADAAVLVVITDFRVNRHRDLIPVAKAGFRLGRAWPDLSGAIGMWLWTLPTHGRCGSVSVWENENALRAFVRWPPHVQVVRRFRGAGTLSNHTWRESRFDRQEIWRQAHQYISNPLTHEVRASLGSGSAQDQCVES